MIAEHLHARYTTHTMRTVRRPSRQPRRGRLFYRTLTLAGLTVSLTVSVMACHDVIGSQTVPAGTSDPASYNTAAGAVAQRNAAIAAWNNALKGMVVNTGALTDELTFVHVCSGCGADPLDQRVLSAGSTTLNISNVTDVDYVNLHTVRGAAAQAIGQLAAYDLAAPPALRGELYAITGYAEILLADLFCSGVPLSTLDFQHDYTLAPSSTTAQVYQDAIVKFDTALGLAADSSRIVNVARVGKGRALLALGQYAAAAQAVASVPDAFTYQVTVRWRDSSGVYDALSALHVQEADREGLNGLPFVSSNDPRTAAELVSTVNNANILEPKTVIRTMNGAGFASITVASGIEARLIEAEAALQANPTGTQWLTILNALRTNGTFTVIPPDTLWNAGTGGVSGLASLADSGASLTGSAATTARIHELFDERAYWLYLTAHRQGDLRRLLRQYRTSFPNPDQVYPTGIYPTGGFYGNDITAPIPSAEYSNPLFHGCIDRDA